MTRMRASAVVLCVALAATACDSGPHGPGSFRATVSGAALGGVLLEISGPGIRGFEGLASTQVYGATLPTPPNTHRVLLIDAAGGELAFGIRVLNIGGDRPVIQILSATDVDNRERPITGIEIRVE